MVAGAHLDQVLNSTAADGGDGLSVAIEHAAAADVADAVAAQDAADEVERVAGGRADFDSAGLGLAHAAQLGDGFRHGELFAGEARDDAATAQFAAGRQPLGTPR